MMRRLSLFAIAMAGVVAAGFLFQSLVFSDAPLAEMEVSTEEINRNVNTASPAAKYKLKYADRRDKEGKKEKGFAKAASYLAMIRGDQVTGKVELADVLAARQAADNMLSPGNRAASLGLQWQFSGPDNVGGRTRAIIFDKDDPKKMYAGGVSGGLYYSDNGGLSWNSHPSNKTMGNLGISAMVQAANGHIYVGTGEFHTDTEASTQASGFIGNGIYKSTDNGQTFVHLSSTTPAPNTPNEAWSHVTEIAVDPNNANKIYASTAGNGAGGLKISTDGGTSWTDATGVDLADKNRPSREVAVGADGTVYASINKRYYRSTDGTNFTNLTGTGGFPVAGDVGRMEFATAPTDANYVYVLMSDNSNPFSEVAGSLEGVLRSTDKGQNWTVIGPGGSPSFNPLGDQGKYDMCIGVGLNRDRIFVGGQLELWGWSLSGGWSLAAFWQPESYENPYYVHADMHRIVFHPTDTNMMFVAGDGGIFQTTNAMLQYPTFTVRNKGYATTQFYGIAASTDGRILGGSQDNGTMYNNLNGNTSNSVLEVNGGDGGHTEFSRINPQALFVETPNAELRRSSNGGSSFASFYDDNVDCQPLAGGGGCGGDGIPDNGAMFISPFKLWELEDSAFSYLFVGTSGKVWFTREAIDFSGEPTWYDIRVNGQVSAFDVTPDGVLFVGTSTGIVYRIDSLIYGDYPADTSNITWSWPSSGATVQNYKGVVRTQIASATTWGSGRFITGLAVDPNDNSHLVATLGQYGSSNYVYRTTTATATTPSWSSIQNNLPEMPVYSAVIDYYNSNNIIVGTEMGVYASSDGGFSWTDENGGDMQRVPVFSLRQEPLLIDGNTMDCRVIYAGTHGRGFFRTYTLLNENQSSCKTNVSVSNVGAFAREVSVYPNPAREQVYLEFNMEKAANAQLYLLDIQGRVYQNTSLGKLATGPQKQELDLSRVPAGMYLVTLRIGEDMITKRIVVTK